MSKLVRIEPVQSQTLMCNRQMHPSADNKGGHVGIHGGVDTSIVSARCCLGQDGTTNTTLHAARAQIDRQTDHIHIRLLKQK